MPPYPPGHIQIFVCVRSGTDVAPAGARWRRWERAPPAAQTGPVGGRCAAGDRAQSSPRGDGCGGCGSGPRRHRGGGCGSGPRRRRRRSRAPSLTNSDAREGVGGEGVCFGTAELRDLSDTLHKQRVSGARLPGPGFRRPASGDRLQATGFRRPASGARLPAPSFRRPASGALFGARLLAPGFRRTASLARLPLHRFPPLHGVRCTISGARLPACLKRLPAHGFRLPLHGSRRTASSARIPASLSRLLAHAGKIMGLPLMIRAHSF